MTDVPTCTLPGSEGWKGPFKMKILYPREERKKKEKKTREQQEKNISEVSRLVAGLGYCPVPPVPAVPTSQVKFKVRPFKIKR